MHKKALWALFVAAATAAFVWGIGTASAVTPPKVCGGQNTNWSAPFACHKDQVIDGVPVHVNVFVAGDGTFAVEFIVPAQTQVATVQVIAHAGVSGSGSGSAFGGDIPAGETSTRIGGRFPDVCQNKNQLDIKWWLGVHEVQSHWPADKRVSGPTFAAFKEVCGVTTTTTAATTTVPQTTVPGQPTTTAAVSPTTVRASSVAGALPPTGPPFALQALAVVVVLVTAGALAVAIERAHRP